jgi:hypothetical protein
MCDATLIYVGIHWWRAVSRQAERMAAWLSSRFTVVAPVPDKHAALISRQKAATQAALRKPAATKLGRYSTPGAAVALGGAQAANPQRKAARQAQVLGRADPPGAHELCAGVANV